jgi:hypothetical protein
LLDAWIVESGEWPNLYVGGVAELSLCARVSAVNGHGEVPRGASLTQGTTTRQLFATVTWVELRKHHLRMVVQHEGAPLAVEPRFAQGPRSPSLGERLRGIPTFLPVQLPVPSVGELVHLQCHVGVMADYDVEQIWTGPDVTTRYTVESIGARVVTPQKRPEGSDEFDDHPEPPTRIVTGFTSTRPDGLAELDLDPGGIFTGEAASAYMLALRPVDPLPRHRL